MRSLEEEFLANVRAGIIKLDKGFLKELLLIAKEKDPAAIPKDMFSSGDRAAKPAKDKPEEEKPDTTSKTDKKNKADTSKKVGKKGGEGKSK